MSHGVFAPTGRIDGTNAPAVEKDILAQLGDHKSLVVDLAGIDYISSAGLRVLLVAAKTARQRGGSLMLVAPKPAIVEILKISGFDKILPIHPTMDAAVAALG